MKSQRSSVSSSNGVKSVTPALLTRIVTGPKASRSFSTAALTGARCDTSAPSAMALPPADLMASTVEVQHADSDAVPGQPPGAGGADAGRRAGDEGYSIGHDSRLPRLRCWPHH
jgi:hypothetical protein